jgi:hypothetical protein
MTKLTGGFHDDANTPRNMVTSFTGKPTGKNLVIKLVPNMLKCQSKSTV